MQDLQLAIAVARVYEGDEGAVFRELLEDRVLPQAASEGNRWLASWAFWMLSRRDMAVRVLIVCIFAGQLISEALETNGLISPPYIPYWNHPRPRRCRLNPIWPTTQRWWCFTSN